MNNTTVRFREINDDHNLARFSQFTARYIDVEYPMDYLRRSKVVAMVSENGLGEIEEMLGGYIMALEAPFRVIQQLPLEMTQLNEGLQKRLSKSMELTGLWIHPVVAQGRLRFKLWWKMFMDMVKLNLRGKRYFVYSYEASQSKLGQMYSLSQPTRIYEGPVFIEGMKEASTEIVEVGSTIALMTGFLSRPLCTARFLCKKLFRRKTILGKLRNAG